MTGIQFRPAGPQDVGTIQAMLEALARQDGAEMRGSAAALLRHGFGALPLFLTVLAARGTKVTDHGNSQARRFYARRGFAPRGDYEGLVLAGEALDALRKLPQT